jgi:hypothetical protein
MFATVQTANSAKINRRPVVVPEKVFEINAPLFSRKTTSV